jgi:phospholipid/cholesterol/gamma-HCH transport system substrate-binding protein
MKKDKSNVHYIHFLSQSAREQLVGAFFIIALLAITSIIIAKINSAKMFDEVITYHAYMKNAQGISTETLVNVSGIEVGKVSRIDITDDNKIHIEFFIYKCFEKLIRIDSTGELSKLSIMGNAVIIITAGTPSLPLLSSGSSIKVKEPITTDDLIEGIKPVINDLESTMSNLAEIVAAIDTQSIKKGSQSLLAIIQNLEHISYQVTSGQGVLGKAIFDQQQAQQLSRTLNNFEKTLTKIDQRINETKPFIENITALGSESRSLVAEVRESLDKINQELKNLPGIVDDTQALIQSTDETVQSIKKIWPLSTIEQQPRKELLINEGMLHD